MGGINGGVQGLEVKKEGEWDGLDAGGGRVLVLVLDNFSLKKIECCPLSPGMVIWTPLRQISTW